MTTMMNEEYNESIDMCCEPIPATATMTDEEWNEPEIPYEVDFGYPRTVEELRASVREAMKHRDDPSYWITDEEFWAEMKKDLPWLKSFGLRL